MQAQSIPIVLTGRDLLARAQTGTGKTAAFGLPMIDRLLVRGRTHAGRASRAASCWCPPASWRCRCTSRCATYGVPAHLRVAAIFGGVAIGPQIQALQRGTDIVVATPGRLLDHMEQRTVDLSAMEILVLDEADRMLDMGFLPPLKRILLTMPKKRQTLLFSATFSRKWCSCRQPSHTTPAVLTCREGSGGGDTVTHRVHPVSEARKGDC